MIEEKLNKIESLQSDIKEGERVLMMKTGQMNDLLKDLAENDLGFPKDSKQYALSELLSKVYQAAKK